MVVAINDLDSRLGALEEAVRSSDNNTTVFRENIREMAEQVILEDEHLTSVRNVLFKPVIEFRKADEALIQRVNEKLNGKLGATGWELTGLATAFTEPNVIAILIRQNDKRNHIYFFDIKGTTDNWISPVSLKLNRIITFNPIKTILAQSDSGDLITIAFNGDSHSLEKSLKADEVILPVLHDKNEAALVVKNLGISFGMQIYDLSTEGKKLSLPQLPTRGSWSIWCLHEPSATLSTAGKLKNAQQWSLLIQTLETKKETKGKRQPTHPFSNMIDLPSYLIPKQILPLAPNELLILDKKGNLHYWEAKRMTPMKLSHSLWNTNSDSILRGGKNRWFAVADKKRLKMWCVRRGGFLHPYEQEKEGLDISALTSPDNLAATSDGRYLFGLANQKVIIWEFPQFTIDQT